ncbi:restriction endonuclease [Actinoplanes sp. HUAS TT8]|uniref:restriction endonuclease n=1 Tax=Actinoplanes sp. HUAS TT8 TaxID=3447453 RepID=UPI003F5252A2
MTNSGESFESYVEYVYRTLLNLHGENIVVARRATVFDTRGNAYNIDVFYEFVTAGIRHRVAIECKDTKRPIERDEAIAFVGKIRDMPSTIGILISKNGFQQGAKKYLQDHGVTHLAGNDLPSFGSVLGKIVATVALPDEKAIGQPFWTIMELRNSKITGNWMTLPNNGKILPLFYSRYQAQQFFDACHFDASTACVRGVEQQTLRFVVSAAPDSGTNFAILHPVEKDGSLQFMVIEYSADEIRDEYLIS